MRVHDPGRGGHAKPGAGHDRPGAAHGKPPKRSFSERFKSGELHHVTKGDLARRIKLDDQYRMRDKGDVARRLGMHKRGPGGGPTGGIRGPLATGAHHRRPYHGWRGHHHVRGRVSRHYVNSCFRFHYWGPSYYPNYCWYPRWSPWVCWSWYYDCPVYWDPRPFWCRPVVYVPAVRWVYYEVPVWTPLPSVSCGTWVDVDPVVVGPQHDLQLLAVRLVDPGHPDEQLGPRYRVWFRNNSQSPVSQPFDVFLFASRDEQLSGALPQAGVRVTSAEPGQVQSVDVRLPFEVASAGAGEGAAAEPFSTLHALVDANREVDETLESNNGITLSREEILPVDPAAFELEPTSAHVGEAVVLAGEGFGPEPGQVLLHLGGIEMEAEILGWYDLGVRVVLPNLPLAGPTEAELIVVRGDGAAANPLEITISPAQASSGPVLPPATPPQ